jgi:hypothetical protein
MSMEGHPEMEGYGGHVSFYVEVPDGPLLGQLLDPEGRMVGLVQAGTMG